MASTNVMDELLLEHRGRRRDAMSWAEPAPRISSRVCGARSVRLRDNAGSAGLLVREKLLAVAACQRSPLSVTRRRTVHSPPTATVRHNTFVVARDAMSFYPRQAVGGRQPT